jgi:hypothetical protein
LELSSSFCWDFFSSGNGSYFFSSGFGSYFFSSGFGSYFISSGLLALTGGYPSFFYSSALTSSFGFWAGGYEGGKITGFGFSSS